MKEIIIDENFKLINGNSLEVLDTIPENSIDSIVTDPPYELGFMGKKWDASGIAYNVNLWEKALKVLKPGGYLLAFGGSRTYHRIACAIEDAGFEIRDCIMWLYGSGFPKSHSVALDIDKLNGCSDRGHRIAVANRCHPDGTVEPNGEELEQYEARTEQGKQWQGWGTALKPAYEPIIVARKPIEDTVARNVLKYGVGAINIDECRVGDEETKGQINGKTSRAFQSKELTTANAKGIDHIGRFPANVITDGSDEVKENMPETGGAGGSIPNTKISGFGKNYGGETQYTKGVRIPYESGEGNACRYFYQAKATKKDRDEGLDAFISKQKPEYCMKYDNGVERAKGRLIKNFHPTVKPVELMQYLVRLVSPKGATILDPFNGSGSTGKAVAFENREREANYKYIGIELDKEYCEISKSRIDYAINKYEYDIAKEEQERKDRGEISIFDFEF